MDVLTRYRLTADAAFYPDWWAGPMVELRSARALKWAERHPEYEVWGSSIVVAPGAEGDLLRAMGRSRIRIDVQRG